MKCTFCPDEKDSQLWYANGLMSVKIEGVQVRFGVCKKHNSWENRINARRKASRELKRLEHLYRRGMPIPEEPCVLCEGEKHLSSGETCWWCNGKGVVGPLQLAHLGRR